MPVESHGRKAYKPWHPKKATATPTSLFLACFSFFFFFLGSVHFYWGSAKHKVFRYHTKSRDA